MKIVFVDDEERERVLQQLLNGMSTLDESVAKYEARIIRRALALTTGNKAKAAELLGVPASTLKSKIKKYGIG
jgi:DNA-binding NtrC family response regulator